MNIICEGRVRFDLERGRLVIEPEGEGVKHLDPGMKVLIVDYWGEVDSPLPVKLTEAGAALAA